MMEVEFKDNILRVWINIEDNNGIKFCVESGWKTTGNWRLGGA